MTEPLTRAQRRELLRHHHPDLGGDPAEFVAVMAAIDRLGSSRGPGRDASPTRGVATATWGRRRRRRVLSTTRAVLPRRFPGARRYGHL